MSAIESVLAARAGFVLAALAVSWLAVALLALVVANLHFRLAHLERSRPAAGERTPFGHLIGRRLEEVLGPGLLPQTRLAFVLSSDCPSCERILGELRRSAAAAPIALLWRDGTPSPPPPLPAGAAVVADGAAVAHALEVRVTPFALAADAAGRIVRAAPVGSVDSLAALLGDAGREAPPAAPAAAVSPSLSPRPLKGVPS